MSSVFSCFSVAVAGGGGGGEEDLSEALDLFSH